MCRFGCCVHQSRCRTMLVARSFLRSILRARAYARMRKAESGAPLSGFSVEVCVGVDHVRHRMPRYRAKSASELASPPRRHICTCGAGFFNESSGDAEETSRRNELSQAVFLPRSWGGALPMMSCTFQSSGEAHVFLPLGDRGGSCEPHFGLYSGLWSTMSGVGFDQVGVGLDRHAVAFDLLSGLQRVLGIGSTRPTTGAAAVSAGSARNVG